MPVQDFKKLVKQMVKKSALTYIEELKDSHTKVNKNKYTYFKSPQEYITNMKLSNTQNFILFVLRSRSIRGIKNKLGQSPRKILHCLLPAVDC